MRRPAHPGKEYHYWNLQQTHSHAHMDTYSMYTATSVTYNMSVIVHEVKVTFRICVFVRRFTPWGTEKYHPESVKKMHIMQLLENTIVFSKKCLTKMCINDMKRDAEGYYVQMLPKQKQPYNTFT